MEKLLTAQDATREEKRERREQAPVNGGTPGEGTETVKDRVRYILRGAPRKKGAYLQQRGYSKPSQSPWGENNLTFSAERPELRTNAPVQGVSTFTHGPLEMRGFTHEENAALLLHSPQVLERELII